MDLVLWRHADAEPGEPDARRVLTSKGLKQAERVGRWLDERLPERARVLVSPAERALQTAKGLDRKFKVMEALGPSTTPSAMLEAIDWPDGSDTVVVVGHQPVLGIVASLLVSGYKAEWKIRKASAWWLSTHTREADGEVVVRCVIGPDCI